MTTLLYFTRAMGTTEDSPCTIMVLPTVCSAAACSITFTDEGLMAVDNSRGDDAMDSHSTAMPLATTQQCQLVSGPLT